MLYAPLSTSTAVEYRPSGLDNQLPVDSKLLACDISPFLSPASALSAVQSRILFASTGQTAPTATVLSSTDSSLTGSSDVSNNLSSSSSLSSSLASLHSVASYGKLSGTALPALNQRSTSRSSVWLKLRVCPAWLAGQLPQCAKLPSPTPEYSESSPTARNGSSVNPSTRLSGSSPPPILCSLYPDSCPYAHPTPNVRVDAGHVTVCYDFLKRKNCKHSLCKYYHPLPHQIEDILKRGDEQKKLIESQQRLLESKISPQLTMQPPQPPHSGLSTAICGPGLIWPPVSAYGAYGQPLSASFNPMATVSSQFASSADTSALNTGALLAAAAALQQQQPSQVVCTPNMLSSSCAQKSAVANGNSGTSTPVAQTSSTITSLLTAPATSTMLTEPWYPSKRAARSADYPIERCPESEPSDALCARNGTHSTGSEEVKCEADQTPSYSEASLLPPGLALPPYCGAISSHDMTAGLSNLINPVNLYGIAFPTQPAVVSSYLPAGHLAYPSLYATQGAPDATNPATMIAFNSWLAQQQQQQQQQHHPPSAAQHFLPAQFPLIQAANSNAALAALAGLQQGAQPSSSDLSGTAQPMSLAFQNQQAALMSLIIRAQQSQLAAAQMAAAVQASGTAGLLQHGSSQRGPVMGSLQNPCLLDPAYQFQALAGLCPTQLLPTISCVPNPITNVAYINDKGHLLESLPICRDFKAGKCHRNTECRYVHLVDENVEVNQGRVIVCRDAAKGRCTRMPCKYYHVPLLAISTNRSIALNSALATAGIPTSQ